MLVAGKADSSISDSDEDSRSSSRFLRSSSTFSAWAGGFPMPFSELRFEFSAFSGVGGVLAMWDKILGSVFWWTGLLLFATGELVGSGRPNCLVSSWTLKAALLAFPPSADMILDSGTLKVTEATVTANRRRRKNRINYYTFSRQKDKLRFLRIRREIMIQSFVVLVSQRDRERRGNTHVGTSFRYTAQRYFRPTKEIPIIISLG